VARIAMLQPDVLLVERSVARSAQEELLSRGISLVLNVKPELQVGRGAMRLGGGGDVGQGHRLALG